MPRSSELAKPVAKVFTSQQAAKRLGVSVSTVQHLVESGALSAWKTAGGHRRILADSVLQYISGRSTGMNSPDIVTNSPARRTRILILEDEPFQRALYEHRLATWNLPATVHFCSNGYEALIEVALHRPEVFLLDLVMPEIDGFEIIRTITSRSDLGLAHIAVLTNLRPEDIEKRGGLPPGIVYMAKPINFDALHGYLMACCALQERRSNANKLVKTPDSRPLDAP